MTPTRFAETFPPLVALDANALDRHGTPRDRFAEAVERLVAAGRLRVVVPGGVAAEAGHPRTPAHVAAAFRAHGADPGRAAPRAAAPTHAQKLDRIRVRAILRGDADTTRHEADAAHVSEAAEAGCRFFVTNDKRILRRRDDLRAVIPGLAIVTPERLLALLDGPGEEGDPCADAGREASPWDGGPGLARPPLHAKNR